MNLLDRCDKPVDMLVNARRLLKPDVRTFSLLVFVPRLIPSSLTLAGSPCHRTRSTLLRIRGIRVRRNIGCTFDQQLPLTTDFVFFGSRTRQIPPSQPLDMDGARCGDGVSFETSLCAFCARSLAPAGFVVESVSKTPYLCGGDARYPFYILYDAIIVCSVEPAAAAADAASFRAAESVDDGQNASERDALV